MYEVTATDAARRFSELLDSIEHGGDDVVIVRHGRRVARIVPIHSANGARVVDFLRANPADSGWTEELRDLRSLLVAEDRSWGD